MTDPNATLDSLKARARKGDLVALQELRRRGFFAPKEAVAAGFAMSSAQRRLWVLDQLNVDRSAYNLPQAFLLEGDLNVPAFRRALAAVVDRHESLRTVFTDIGGEPQQQVQARIDFALEDVDLSSRPDPDDAARVCAVRQVHAAFDLSRGPLIRASLLRLTPSRHVFVFTAHHIVCDGWSLGVLAAEVSALYNAFAEGRENPLPALPLQYRDYAAWQNAQLRNPETTAHREYWHRRLSGALSTLDLADRPRPAVQTFAGDTACSTVDASLVERFEQLGREHGATLFMALLAAVKVLLYRYSSQEDLIVGSPVAERGHPDLENQIGMYVNMLAFRDHIQSTDSFVAVLAQVRQTALEAYAHQAYPFDLLVSELDLDRDLSRPPLFNVVVAFEDNDARSLDLLRLRATEFDTRYSIAKFDLTVFFTRTPAGLGLALTFNTDLFSPDRIRRMGDHFERLIRSIVQNPQQPVGSLSLLSGDEIRQQVNFGLETREYPGDRTIASVFEAQVERGAGRVAVACEGVRWTYRELNERANAVARRLAPNCAGGPETRVAVLLDRSEWVAAALVGILKAGGAYVPLDPSYPRQRMEYILRQTGCRVILTEAKYLEDGRAVFADIDAVDIRQTAASPASGNPPPVGTGRHLAYVIYTSGSTGQPKGNLIEQRSVLRLVLNTNYIELSERDRILQTGSLAFDASTFEIWGALLNGAAVVFAPEAVILDAAQLKQRLQQQHITAMWLTSSLFNQLLDADPEMFGALRHLLVGGEKLSPAHVNRVRALHPALTVINGYGPTENTTFTACWRIDRDCRDEVPIGRPVANTEVVILDAHGELVPLGVAGEICAGGDGLSRGYLGDPALTAEQYVPHPFRAGARLYRTGDLGRWRPDGLLDYLGRRDTQVKIRGYRVELGEIEHRLLQHAAVRNAVVTVRETASGDRRLTAHVILESDLRDHDLRNHLRSMLPDYMIPAEFVKLPQFPLTPAGKVDRAQLASSVATRHHPEAESLLPPGPSPDAPDEPRSGVERTLAAIWRDLLGLSRIGIHANFFDVGGHSLNGIQLVARIHRELDARISLRDVFRTPTIAELAALIETSAPAPYTPIRRVPEAEHYAVSNAQRRLWVLEKMATLAGAYNIPGGIELRGSLDVASLRRALHTLVERHESLRTTFIEVDGEPRQVIHPDIGFDLEVVDRRGEPFVDGSDLSSLFPGWSFDLERGPLFSARLLRFGEDRHVLLFNMHHIVSDGWSMDILLTELVRIYLGDSLPPLSIQCKDCAQWQRDELSKPEVEAHRRYWHQKLSGELPLLDVGPDAPRPPVQTFRGDVFTFELGSDLSGALRRLGRGEGASELATFLAMVTVLLSRHSGQDDIIVGSPAAARDHPDLQNQIGFYVNMLALRNRVPGSASFLGVLQSVRDTLAEALEHQVYPYDRLVEDLGIRRDMGRNPLFDCVVTSERARRLPVPPAAVASSTLEVSPFAVRPTTSKFDLTFAFSEGLDGACEIAIEYNTDLFRRDRIERMAAGLQELATSIVRDPGQPVRGLSILTPRERGLLESWALERRRYEADRTIASVFEAQVERGAGRVAVACEGVRWTYRELNERANAVARRLAPNCAGGPETRVAVLLDRSEWVAAALVGILKAGGAYVPLDPSYPRQRMEYILRQTGCRVILTEAKYLEDGRAVFADIDAVDIRQTAASPASGNPPPVGTGRHLAYVIYTSGSTGQPKGNLIEQRSVLRLVLNTNYIELSERDRILQTGSLAFDASTFEIWGALLNGAAVVFAPEAVILDAAQLKQRLQQQHITAMWLTSSLFNQLLDADPEMFGALRHLLVGGEKLSPAHVNRVRALHPALTVINGYGPTENTTFTACWRIDRDCRDEVPIGRPVANTEVVILDAHGELVPLGVAGEICAGGDGLSRGYLGDPALTAEQYVPHPFRAGARLYRTGDLGRWRPDGLLDYLGRRDTQVKIRGYRVELGEIEHRLLQHDAITEAVVIALDATAAAKRLVAYYSATRPVSRAMLRSHLASALPGYMIPSDFIALDRLPLTANGKLDRHALPEPARSQDSMDVTLGLPRTERERALVTLWQDVLGLDRVGIDDNYFELGGDSIRAIQLVSRLRRRGWHLEVGDLFANPTIRELAPHTSRTQGDPGDETVRGVVPLTAIQRWFLRHAGDLHHFNQAVLLRAAEPLDEAALRLLIDKLSSHHDALRMVYRVGSGGVQQINLGPEDVAPHFSVLAIHPADIEGHAARLQASFDLSKGPLINVVLYRCDDGDRLLIIVHHLVVDGVSWRVLLDDLERGYRQLAGGQSVDFGPKTASFRAWAEATGRFAHSPQLHAELPYWLDTCSEPSPQVPRPAPRLSTPDVVSSSLSKEQTAFLLGPAHRAYHTEINDMLLTALGRALKRWHGTDATLIALEGHGREDPGEPLDVSSTVGWFTSLFPFRLGAPGDDIGLQIKSVKENLRGVPRKGMGFGILRYLAEDGIRARFADIPAPSVSFNYLGQFQTGPTSLFEFAVESSGPAVSPTIESDHALDITAFVLGERLEFSLIRSRRGELPDSTDALRRHLEEELAAVADHCRSRATGEKTPSDFTQKTLSPDFYRALLESNGWSASDIDDVCPLSPMQEGLLFQTLYDQDPHSYVVQMSFRVDGPLNIDAFQRAWRMLCHRHVVLRSAFVHEGLPQPLQVVLKERPLEFLVLDLAGRAEDEHRRRIQSYRQQDLDRGFDVATDSLMRFAIIDLGHSRHHMVWSYHHLILDGWSFGVVYREFREIYEALVEGRAPTLAPPASHAGYIRWLTQRDAAAGKRYWAEYLAGYTQIATFNRHGGRRAGPYEPRDLTLSLDEASTAALKALAVRSRVTLSSAVQALWGLLLARYNDTDDVVFGAIVSGRPPGVKDIEAMAGLFINAIPVRVRFPAGAPFAAVIRSVQDSSLLHEQFQYLPLADVQRESELGGSLFDHLLIFQNYPTPADASDAEFTVDAFEVHDRTHYDFNLIVIPGARLDFKFTYNGRAFAREDVARVGRHLVRTIRQAVEHPDMAADDVQILDEPEFNQVVHAFNDTACARKPGQSVVDLFEEQVRRTPDAAAVVYKDSRLSYAEVNRRADLIAAALATHRQERVAIAMDRSDLLIPAILGILKAGAAYVPIDPASPEQSRRFILEDSGCGTLLTEGFCSSAIEQGIRPAAIARRGELAYVIYTSGSTGVPKGCQIDHVNLHHYLTWADSYYPPSATWGLYSPLSFDLTVTSLFLPLIRGNTIRVFPQDAAIDELLLDAFSAGSPIDTIKLTPSHISLLKELGVSSTNMRTVIVGGEALTLDHVRFLHRVNPGIQVFNEYGPTETTVGCVAKRIEPDDHRVLIGRPISNTQIYILDRRREPVSIGLPGEMYIGGHGVSRGYVNRDALNQQRFLANPFVPGQRIYRTGDVGRWLEDGNIEYLGRNDDQVKIRGHRVEPQEVEHHLRQYPAVRDAVVVADDSGQAGPELVAYVTGSVAGLRDFLQGRLPDYMLPAYLVEVEKIPLTRNGKLDRRALPDPRRRRLSREVVAPRDAIERQLTSIWRHVLQTETVGVRDNFFDLGGHSLKAMQIASRIHRDLGVKLSLRALFTNPTVEQLAAKVRRAEASRFSRIDRAPERPHYELSHAQKRIWLAHHMKAAIAYNMPRAFLLREAPDMDALKHALEALVARHESLRTAFVVIDEEPRQRVLDTVALPIEEVDLRGIDGAEETARRLVEAQAHLPFDLTQPPLLRAAAVRLDDSRMVLSLVMHHIIGDGWSMSVFYGEIFAMYEAFRRQEPNPLPPLRIQYKDFAAWQNAQDFQEQERYWLSKLTPPPEKVRLPFDFQAPDDRDFAGRTQFTDLDEHVVARLRAIAARRKTTLSNVVLAVFDLLLHQFMRQEDICVGMAIANRHHPDLEHLIGIFVNILPIRVHLTPDTTFDELLDQVVDNVQEAFECQDYPFDLLVERLNPDRAAGRNPLLNVIYGFQNFEDAYIDLGAKERQASSPEPSALQSAEPLDIEFRTAKFDLTLFVTDMDGRLRLTMEYDVGVFADATIRWMLATFERFAEMAKTEEMDGAADVGASSHC